MVIPNTSSYPPSVWIALRTCVSTFCWKMAGFTALFTDPQKSSKHRFQYKFGSHSTIHIFKKNFTIVFSVFNNKRYQNKPLIKWAHNLWDHNYSTNCNSQRIWKSHQVEVQPNCWSYTKKCLKWWNSQLLNYMDPRTNLFQLALNYFVILGLSIVLR